MKLLTLFKLNFIFIILFLFCNKSLQPIRWEINTLDGEYIGFEIIDDYIYLGERFCDNNSGECHKSKILKIDTLGKIKDSLCLNCNLWYLKSKGASLLFATDKGYLIYTKDFNFYDTISLLMQTILLNDSLVLYGKSCSSDEGDFDNEEVPENIFIKNLKTKNIDTILLNAEPIDAKIVADKLFIIGRSGNFEKVTYKLYVLENLNMKSSIKEANDLFVTGPGFMTSDISFVNDTILIYLDTICYFLDEKLKIRKAKEVSLDSLKGLENEFLFYSSQMKLFFIKNNEIMYIKLPKETEEIYTQLAHTFIKNKGTFYLSNFGFWGKSLNKKKCFYISSSRKKAIFYDVIK